MTKSIRRTTGLAALAAILMCAPARGAAAEAWTLTRVTTIGSTQYTQEEVVGASGLAKGATVSVADLKAAADRLAQSGAFANVTFKYERSGGDFSVAFTLVDAPDLLPVRYENFVWVGDDEIDRYLAASVPLFHGRVSPRGAMVQRIADALTQWLSGRSLPGTVVSRMHVLDGEDEGPAARIDAVGYSVAGVPMPVRTVEFENVSNLTPDERAQAVKSAMAISSFERTLFQDKVWLSLGRVYSKKGFLRARLVSLRVRSVGPAAASPELAVTCVIDEGRQYRVGRVEWTQPAPEGAADAVLIETGSPSDGSSLNGKLGAMRKQLVARGYLRAEPRADYRFHDETSTVDYLLDAGSGPLFRMGTVQFEGVAESVRDRLGRKWKLQPGDVFLPDYVSEFLEDNRSVAAGRAVTYRRTVTEANVVKVTVEFKAAQ